MLCDGVLGGLGSLACILNTKPQEGPEMVSVETYSYVPA